MPVFQFWCFQVIIEWEISFSKALYIPIPHPVEYSAAIAKLNEASFM